jgi:hypothetical protein
MAKDINSFVFPYMFGKKGYFYMTDTCNPIDVKFLVEAKNVKYLYCTVRSLDSAQSMLPFLKRLVMQRGSVKVWELQTVDIPGVVF